MLELAVIMLAASVLAVAVLIRLRIPSLLGYLGVGLVLGDSGLGVIEHSEGLHRLAELGVVFLLFTVGLELSVGTLVAMRREVFGLGAAQVLVTTVLIAAAGWLLGLAPGPAIMAAGALAMSSTAIVVRQLHEQDELQAPHGRLALAVLLFQDLAVVPFLITLPVLAGDGGDLGLRLAQTLTLGIATIVAMVAIGRWFWRPALHRLARLRSRELFTLTILLAALAAATVTHAAGLSLPLGGFIAGLVLGETGLQHQIERDIRPFRDVFLGLFFLMVGLMVDLRASADALPWLLVLVPALLLGKGALIYLLSRLWRTPSATAARTAIVLAPGGEFGLTLLVLALTMGLVPAEVVQPLLAAVIVTMVMAPYLIRHNGLAAGPFGAGAGDAARPPAQPPPGAAGPVVIVGGLGGIGQVAAQLLDAAGLRYTAVDLDLSRTNTARGAGDAAVSGDTAELLGNIGLDRPAAVVVAVDELEAAAPLTAQLRRRYPGVPIITRSRSEDGAISLMGTGATQVVPEPLMAGLALGEQVLSRLGIAVERRSAVVEAVRNAHLEALSARAGQAQPNAQASEDR